MPWKHKSGRSNAMVSSSMCHLQSTSRDFEKSWIFLSLLSCWLLLTWPLSLAGSAPGLRLPSSRCTGEVYSWNPQFSCVSTVSLALFPYIHASTFLEYNTCCHRNLWNLSKSGFKPITLHARWSINWSAFNVVAMTTAWLEDWEWEKNIQRPISQTIHLKLGAQGLSSQMKALSMNLCRIFLQIPDMPSSDLSYCICTKYHF